MSYQALYRVWRPQRFGDLIGQEHVTQTLKNALKEGQLAHAYLFHGPRGTGKTSAAKILAKAVNCEQAPTSEPCNQCDRCVRIMEGRLMDVIEIDAASNRGVDDIRELRDQVKYAPTEARYKVYIIDEAHMLTTEAFNALLKTLEEPPAHVLFILATTEPHKLLPTILSRCQRFSFRRISFEQIVDLLAKVCKSQKVQYDPHALCAIARAAEGGLRDALSLLDQSIAFGGDRLEETTVQAITGSISKQSIYAMFEWIAKQDVHQALSGLDDHLMQGLDAERILDDLVHTCRDLLLMKTAPSLSEVQVASVQDLKPLEGLFTQKQLSWILEQLIHYSQQMKWVAYPRVVLEMAMIQLCSWEQSKAPSVQENMKTPDEQLKRLEKKIVQLEKKLANHQPSSVPEESLSRKTGSSMEKQRVVFHSNEQTMDWISQLSQNHFNQVKKVWPQLLQQVKETKITVHAWLIDGEPVGATPNRVIVAFKSKIHRDTTEKAENKSVIEKNLRKLLGKPYHLQTLMWDDWEQLQTQSQVTSAEETVSEVSQISEPDQESAEDDFVQKAKEVFGEDLIEVIE